MDVIFIVPFVVRIAQYLYVDTKAPSSFLTSVTLSLACYLAISVVIVTNPNESEVC